MPSAEIIAIGTELLLGEIQDSNTQYLARMLREIGVDLYRASMVGDNQERIAQTIREALSRAQIVITSGGLGPTVDDPTRQAVAQAVDTELEYKTELWQQIEERFRFYGRTASENNKRQAYIPHGAIAIKNPVGTAPAFYFEPSKDKTIISLPGVPRELYYLFENAVTPYLKEKYGLKGTILARVLHTSGIGESMVDELIGDLEICENPTVGLLAHPGQTDVRITAKADSQQEAMRMIAEMEELIRERLGHHIYGVDRETLPVVLIKLLDNNGWKLALVEMGTSDETLRLLQSEGFKNTQAVGCESFTDKNELLENLQTQCQKLGSDVGLLVQLRENDEKQTILDLIAVTPHQTRQRQRYYGGAPALTTTWAANTALDFLRRTILETKSDY
jgi:competence/damage-inducible protein CinA-like protein